MSSRFPTFYVISTGFIFWGRILIMQCLRHIGQFSPPLLQKNHPNKCHTGSRLIPALLCAASSSSLLLRMNQQRALPAGTELNRQRFQAIVQSKVIVIYPSLSCSFSQTGCNCPLFKKVIKWAPSWVFKLIVHLVSSINSSVLNKRHSETTQIRESPYLDAQRLFFFLNENL